MNWKKLEKLIFVAGHAVYTALDYRRPGHDTSWLLQDFQKGEPPCYIEHIQRGVELAAGDERALLLFSGGQTRLEAGPRSEAQSYWQLAEYFGWWGQSTVRARTATEEFARDSLENMLFSLCRFRELAGHYPARLTAVSWGFKAERFELHRAALRWPAEKFEFVGVNNPRDLAAAFTGERRNALEPFQRDPYGVRVGPPDKDSYAVYLGDKRAARNPFRRQPPYALTCPEAAGLLNYCGTKIYTDALPW